MAYYVDRCDYTPSNVLPSGAAGAALSIGDLVYMDSNGAWQKADQVANTATTRLDALGVMVQNALADQQVSPVRIADIRGYTGLTIGAKQYLSDTAGGVTSTEPTTNTRQVVGFARAADCIHFAIGGASGAQIDVGGDMNADSLSLVSTLAVGTNATVGGTLAVTGVTTLTAGIKDATDVPTGTTTGTIIATAASEKLGFWGATAVVQPASASQAALTKTAVTAVLTTASLTTAAHGFATGTQADAIVARVNQLVVDMAATETLINQLRSELVTTGIIKGSA